MVDRIAPQRGVVGPRGRTRTTRHAGSPAPTGIDTSAGAMHQSEAVVPTALVVTLSVSQLRALVAGAATEAIERAIAPRGEWMTRMEVAEMIGYEESYVSELVRRRGLPAQQPGGRGSRLVFKRSEVEAWIAREGRR